MISGGGVVVRYDEQAKEVVGLTIVGVGRRLEEYVRVSRADRVRLKVNATFPQPKTGKIVITVINHYGDDVLKVFEV